MVEAGRIGCDQLERVVLETAAKVSTVGMALADREAELARPALGGLVEVRDPQSDVVDARERAQPRLRIPGSVR